jgi:hypothetical protein
MSPPANLKVAKAYGWRAASQQDEQYQTISAVKVAVTMIDSLPESSHHARESQAKVR